MGAVRPNDLCATGGRGFNCLSGAGGTIGFRVRVGARHSAELVHAFGQTTLRIRTDARLTSPIAPPSSTSSPADLERPIF